MTFYVPEDKVTDIRNAADIVDIVSEVVLLKKTGKNHKGLCPFHSEKTPSFTVDPEQQMFYCFGCGIGGNVFSFLMKHEGITFPEAAKTLARRYGIEIPTPAMSRAQKEKIGKREKILAINRLAKDFFIHVLSHSPSGQNGMAYLKKRGMTKEVIDSFSIGYAPGGWDSMVTYLSKKKVPLELAVTSGLIMEKRRGGYYDRFRDRIIFPIFDMGKNVIGFGGRVMDDSLPKYLNSPETPVYNKSRSLYGLHLTKQRIREAGVVYIVEGYLDLLALFQHNIKNAVATLGTALTLDHVSILRGHADKVVLVYDSDEAGIKAARRSIQVFNQGHVDARILVLPEGYDPDSYLFEFGPDAFNKIAADASGAMEFLIDYAIKKHGVTVEGKIRIISDVKEHLAEISDGVARSLYIKVLSEKIDVDDTAILEKVRETHVANKGKIRKQRSFSNVSTGPNQHHVRDPVQQVRLRFSKMERQIIAMMLQFPEILPEIREKNILKIFESNILRNIGRLVLDQEDSKAVLIPDLLAKADNSEIRQVIASLSIGDDAWDYEGCLNLIAQFISSRANREKNLLNKIKAAEAQNDHDLLVTLLREKQLQIKKKAISKQEC